MGRAAASYVIKKHPDAIASGCFAVSIEEIILHQFLQQFIAVDLADQAARIVVVGDVGGVFREKITYDLIDGIVALFAERTIHGGQNPLHFRLRVIGYYELDGIVVVQGFRLLTLILLLSYTETIRK